MAFQRWLRMELAVSLWSYLADGFDGDVNGPPNWIVKKVSTSKAYKSAHEPAVGGDINGVGGVGYGARGIAIAWSQLRFWFILQDFNHKLTASSARKITMFLLLTISLSVTDEAWRGLCAFFPWVFFAMMSWFFVQRGSEGERIEGREMKRRERGCFVASERMSCSRWGS